MKSVARQSNKKAAFTIIELLTVMSVIILLMSLLVPALTMLKRYAKRVMQKNQFHSIEVAMDLFNAEWEDYPPSDLMDDAMPPRPYCGAMKLCEAMVGWDLLGFHPDSRFNRDGSGVYADPDRSGRRQYLKAETANAYRMGDIYSDSGTRIFGRDNFVLCDVYNRVTHMRTGKLIGMPVLYYKADTSKTRHNVTDPDDTDNIYNYTDNYEFTRLGMPWRPGEQHAIFIDTAIFYQKTRNEQIQVENRPYRADSYILLSAGWDGEYGTDDDVFNFGY